MSDIIITPGLVVVKANIFKGELIGDEVILHNSTITPDLSAEVEGETIPTFLVSYDGA